MPNNKCLKIIFNLKKRESYLKRYFLLLQQYTINFDILLINDLGTTVNFDAENTLETKIICSQSNNRFDSRKNDLQIRTFFHITAHVGHFSFVL